MNDEAKIDKIREYIAKCPYLKQFAELNVEYLADKVETYSVNENANTSSTIIKYE